MGSAHVAVRLRVDSKFGAIEPLVADMRRDDLPQADTRIPDPFHGWQFNATDLPASLMKGKHKIVLFGKAGDGQLHAFGGQNSKGAMRCLCDDVECPC